MKSYYTRACNFYYGKKSILLVNKKKAFPLHGLKEISFDKIEIISRRNRKKISIKDINKLPKILKKKVQKDIYLISTKKNNFSNLNFKKLPNVMGILNLTPDSFSDGGKYNKKNSALKHVNDLFLSGSDIVDIGGESTKPGSNNINEKKEWNRIKHVIKKIGKKKNISLDTRKSKIMEKGILRGVNLVNDVSGLSFDSNSINVLKKYKIPFVLQHTQGTPDIMQKNPKYKNALLDIYDYFFEKLKKIRKAGIFHNNIILDPGIGFGKNLKHNIQILRDISLFHSFGFPILLGISRKRFIKDLSGKNDSKYRLGGTISSAIYAMTQGIQIIRVHDVNEVLQGIKVFKEFLKN